MFYNIAYTPLKVSIMHYPFPRVHVAATIPPTVLCHSIPDLTDLELVAGIQEEMALPGHSIWELSYFLRASGEILDGEQIADLPTTRQETALPRPADLLLTPPPRHDLVRMSELFAVFLWERLQIFQVEEVEGILSALWSTHAGEACQVQVVLQERFVTPDR
jgi:hypothetical protein